MTPEQELARELMMSFNIKIIGLVIKVIIMGFIFMTIKNFISRLYNYVRLKLSDFGRGTKVEIGGRVGHIQHITFLGDEVEIKIDEKTLMLVPIKNFLTSNKVILQNGIPDNKPSGRS